MITVQDIVSSTLANLSTHPRYFMSTQEKDLVDSGWEHVGTKTIREATCECDCGKSKPVLRLKS